MKLQKELTSTRAALVQREEEQAAGKKALLLAEELERQYCEQADAEGLVLKVRKC